MPSSSWDEWEEINGVLVLDDNFATLRKVLQESPPPSIPYLGMFDFLFNIIPCFFINSFLDPFALRYLSDLTIKDVEQNFIADNLVNFSKMRLLRLLILPAHFFFLTYFFSPYLEQWRESLVK